MRKRRLSERNDIVKDPKVNTDVLNPMGVQILTTYFVSLLELTEVL